MKCSFSSPLSYSTSIPRRSLHAYMNYEARTKICSQFQTIRLLSVLSAAQVLKEDGRNRLSRIWVPTGGIAISPDEDSHAKLVRAGFLRQAHSGIFHMLPLGRRVQEKLEALIDKYMSQLGASKLELSSISSEDLWSRSGRLNSIGSELFRFQDRKETRYILSPTHEEEITSLVANNVASYKDLPIRLYQISRKYRDELRPRHGLLRTREFVMKDLYTFDCSPALALATYHEVKAMYTRLFSELKLPYLVAEADSGDMGGKLSHEFHFPTPKGEDHIISCNTCDYVANEELAECALPVDVPSKISIPTVSEAIASVHNDVKVWRGVSRNRDTLINVWYSPSLERSLSSSEVGPPEVNINAIKALIPDLDASVQDCLSLWANQSGHVGDMERGTTLPYPRKLLNLVDCRLPPAVQQLILSKSPDLPFWPASLKGLSMDGDSETLVDDPITQKPLNLLRIRAGDLCPRCPGGRLDVQKAIELGHTFHLGTRYSEPLSASVAVPSTLLGDQPTPAERVQDKTQNLEVSLQMGCHGIGVTRMIGAVAETLADSKGLNWPRMMAPFEVAIVPGNGLEEAASVVYDTLISPGGDKDSVLDLIIDDRLHSFPWKMKDADLVGYPVIVVVGRRWVAEQVVEIQCRRLRIREEMHITKTLLFVASLLLQL